MNKEFFKGMNLAQDISEEDFSHIVEEFKKVEDVISKDQFISEFNERKSYYEDSTLMNDKTIVSLIVGPLSLEENETLSEITEDSLIKINDFDDVLFFNSNNLFGKIIEKCDFDFICLVFKHSRKD